MFSNSTILINTTTTSAIVDDYDYRGAAIYIGVILIWYSTGLVLMLFFHVRPRALHSQFIFDYETTNKSTPSTTNPFANYHNIQADHTKKQILNELKDPERRQRLWKIYYGTAEQQNEPHPQYHQTITADSVTIGHIKKQLDEIHRLKVRDDDMIPASFHSPSNDAIKPFTKRFIPIRRSSGVATDFPRPLFRVHSQPDTAITTAETEPFISETHLKAAPSNGTRRRNQKFFNRFIVEKVPELK